MELRELPFPQVHQWHLLMDRFALRLTYPAHVAMDPEWCLH